MPEGQVQVDDLAAPVSFVMFVRSRLLLTAYCRLPTIFTIPPDSLIIGPLSESFEGLFKSPAVEPPTASPDPTPFLATAARARGLLSRREASRIN